MDRRRLFRYAPIAGVFVLVVLVGALVLMIRSFIAHKGERPERVVQEVTLLRPPPPPPPDQPPPPPVPKVEQQIQQREPVPTPDNTPPPRQQLGLDTTGTAGGDSFGLVARRGGGDLIGTGGAVFAWYTGKLKDQVLQRLSTDAKLRSKKYSVSVQIWIASDGRIEQTRLTSSTGDRELDSAIAAALNSLGRLDQRPPLEMPQPISLRIVSHG